MVAYASSSCRMSRLCFTTLSRSSAIQASERRRSPNTEAVSASGSMAWKVKIECSAAKDRKSTRLNSSHGYISYAVFCLKKKKNRKETYTESKVKRSRCEIDM